MGEYFQALGRISVLYSNLDFFMTLIIHGLMSSDLRIGAIVTDRVASFSDRVDLAGSLSEARLGDSQQAAAFNSLLDRVRAVRNQRNRFIHDLKVANRCTPSAGES